MALATTEMDYIRKLVLERSAIVIDADKGYLVESRLLPLARKEGFGNLNDLVGKLKASPFNGLHRQVVDAMTTNETSFFRDLHPFDALKKVVIPKILEARSNSKTLTLWCGASSSGQEPYSVCMLLRENFPELLSWKIRFIATDLSREMLERSRNGKYSQLEVNRGLPASLLVKYFARHGMEWQLKDDLRKMVEFQELNLVENWNLPAGIDLVFLRNVLIYFDVETKKNILKKIRRYMKPDGFLFLGGSETTLNLDDKFERVQVEKTWCYRPLE